MAEAPRVGAVETNDSWPIKMETPECKIMAVSRVDFVEGCLRGLHMYLPWARREGLLRDEGLGLIIEPPTAMPLPEIQEEADSTDQEMTNDPIGAAAVPPSSVIEAGLLQTTVPQRSLGRVTSIWYFGGSTMFLGALPIGLVGDAYGLRLSIAIASSMFLLMSLWYVVVNPALRQWKAE